MPQPICQVRILTPEIRRFEQLCTLVTSGAPDLLKARCLHLRELPPLAGRDGDVILIDHFPAQGCDALRLARRHRAEGGRQTVIVLLPPGTPAGAVSVAQARLAGAADCLPDHRTDAFTLPRIVKGACAQAEADEYHPPPGTREPSERALLLEHILAELGSMAGRIDAAGRIVSLCGPLYDELFPGRGDPVGRSGFELFTDREPFLRGALAGKSVMFMTAVELRGRQRQFQTFLLPDAAHQDSVVFLMRDATGMEERSTRALSESRSQFQMLLERSLDAILLVDDEGMCIEANRAASQALGFPEAAMVGRYMDEIGFRGFVPLQAESRAQTWFQSASPAVDFSFTRPDGQVRLLSITTYRASPHFLLCILHDATAQRRLEREILEVSDQERQRFSLDLHDGLGQHLAGVGYLAAALAARLKGRGGAEAAEAARISELIAAAITQTREIAHGIYPPELLEGQLPDALKRLAETCRTVYQTDCSFEPAGCNDLPPVPRQTLLHLYRIAQEATTNAHRHGQPGTVKIRLTRAAQLVTLSVHDDGHGFDAVRDRASMGLRMMDYRATLLGGTLTVRSDADGAGTLIACEFDPAAGRDGSGPSRET